MMYLGTNLFHVKRSYNVSRETWGIMIYFDNSATSYPKPLEVIGEVNNVLSNFCGNPGRGGYELSRRTSRYLSETRKEIAVFLGVSQPSHLIFTSGCTESTNGVINSLVKPGDHVVLSGLEHNATWRPLKAAERQGVKLTVVKNPLNLKGWEAAITSRTKLFVVNHGSNVNGTIAPIKEITAIAHRYGIPVLGDFAQTAGLLPLNFEELAIDYGAVAGHKGLLGVGGIGLLYIKNENSLEPWRLGGTGTFSGSPMQKPAFPEGFEAGTGNMVGVGSLRGGVEFLNRRGIRNIRHHEKELIEGFLRGIRSIPNITVYEAFSRERLPVVSLNIGNLSAVKAAKLLEREGGIAVRFGLQCSGLAHRTIGTINRGTVRFSFGYQNTPEEINKGLETLYKVARL